MKHTYTKKEALRIMISTAKEYAKLLEGMNYLFIETATTMQLNILKHYFFRGTINI